MRGSCNVRAGIGIATVILYAGLIGAFPAHAARGDSVKVQVACPTVLPASGGPLTVNLTLVNDTSVTQTIAKSALVVHLGNLEALGPFVVPLTESIPARQTRAVSPYLATTVGGGTLTAGTFASVGVVVMDGANKPLGSGYCLVQIA